MGVRSLKRNIAKEEMGKKGMRRICSHAGSRKEGRSWFSACWKKYVPEGERSGS